MSLLNRILRRLGLLARVEQAGACVVCQQGPSPALGVPILTVDGTWKHLVCMIAGQQIAQVAEHVNAQPPSPATQPQESRSVIFAIVRPAGREVWN